jgi:hypothetical protein
MNPAVTHLSSESRMIMLLYVRRRYLVKPQLLTLGQSPS